MSIHILDKESTRRDVSRVVGHKKDILKVIPRRATEEAEK